MGGLFARNARRYPDVMNAMSMPAAPAPRSVGLREVGQRAGEIYREVESSGVPVTVTDGGRLAHRAGGTTTLTTTTSGRLAVVRA